MNNTDSYLLWAQNWHIITLIVCLVFIVFIHSAYRYFKNRFVDAFWILIFAIPFWIVFLYNLYHIIYLWYAPSAYAEVWGLSR